MKSGLEIAVAIYVAYLVGSLSSAIIVCRLMRLPDPRTQGSRNPGATNVLRIGGKVPAAITLLGDVLKGVLPVIVARWYSFDLVVQGWVALGAFLGHLFPIYYRFEGGKGVATYIGCLFALNWVVGLAWCAAWLVVAIASRYVSVASMIACLLAPLYMWFFTHNWELVATLAFMSLLVVMRHRLNIQRLVQGTENKLSFSGRI